MPSSSISQLPQRSQPYRLLLKGLPKLSTLKVDVVLGSSSANGIESSDRARTSQGHLTLEEHDHVPSADLAVRLPWSAPFALRSGNLVQYVAVTVFFTIGAFLFEARVVHWTTEFSLALGWLAVALSIGSIGLLYWLIRHQAATSVASLFYLVPAVTSLMAFVLFDERLDAVAIAGMIACAAAVLVVNRPPAKV